MTFSRSTPFKLLAIVIAFMVALPLVLRAVRPAPTTPDFFDKSVTIPAALDASRKSGKPALLFVTADWCGPCQSFKRGALSEARVGEWIASNTHPVYVDGTDALPAAAEGFAIRAFPTMLIVRDGREVARIEGGRDSDELLAWLRTSMSQ